MKTDLKTIFNFESMKEYFLSFAYFVSLFSSTSMFFDHKRIIIDGLMVQFPMALFLNPLKL
ncbi:hypothetical protein [Francisella sp. 19X1-34]|uniref:hypothetical protein n=1 Tax=Francisella sp. 19X1-34 TaxID=3087177 RepID=UPI002E2FEDC2|nr:hypothetical protein [Francisella sp. 19X1-34]MED7789475.1 hypothetical protein [Francisella sp. 19X1-34]